MLEDIKPHPSTQDEMPSSEPVQQETQQTEIVQAEIPKPIHIHGKCSECGKIFLSGNQLKKHMCEHFSCPECNKPFYTSCSLERHVANYHQKAR